MSTGLSIAKQMEKKGMRLQTWALSKGLSSKDMKLLGLLSFGHIKGSRGRSKELREMLEKEGFYAGDSHEKE